MLAPKKDIKLISFLVLCFYTFFLLLHGSNRYLLRELFVLVVSLGCPEEVKWSIQDNNRMFFARQDGEPRNYYKKRAFLCQRGVKQREGKGGSEVV